MPYHAIDPAPKDVQRGSTDVEHPARAPATVGGFRIETYKPADRACPQCGKRWLVGDTRGGEILIERCKACKSGKR